MYFFFVLKYCFEQFFTKIFDYGVLNTFTKRLNNTIKLKQYYILGKLERYHANFGTKSTM